MRKVISGWCIMAIVVLAGCSTLRKDQKRLAIIEVRNPQLLASACAEKYPPKLLPPIIKQGETKYLPGDTVIVEGKRIPCPPNGKDTVWMQCPPSKVIHDTIVRTDTAFIQVLNTAQIAAKDAQIHDLTSKMDSWQQKAEKRGKWNLYLIIGLALSLGWNFRKLIIKMFI